MILTMELQPCNHIRVRGGEGCERNLETLVKLIETQFKTDITLLSNWRELLNIIADNYQKYESKIKSANRRKLFIIDKLHVQNFRPSPFNLTDNLARTAYLWKDIELENKKRKEYPKLDVPLEFSEIAELSEEMSEVELTAHPNSEIYQPADLVEPPTQATPVEVETSITNLPVNICTNQHKLISPLGSKFTGLDIKQKESHEIYSNLGCQEKKLVLLNETKCIVCTPSEIIIDNILKEQVARFFLTNSCTEALYIRFRMISDKSPFKKETTIYPRIPIKLYPGLIAAYKFVFKLKPNIDNLKTYLCFRIGRNVMSGAPDEVLNIPLSLKPSEHEKISITEIVNIIPIYSWQINASSNFPHEKLEICVNNNHSYYVHIKKRVVDFIEEAENHNLSVDVTGINTESLMQKIEDNDIETRSTLLSPSKKEDLISTTECITVIEFIYLIVDDIVNLALDTFIFEKTFLYIRPYSKYTITVLFSKVEHDGYHQCYYDVDFYDPYTEILLTTKTIKIFAEVLPHPIQLYPKILDMSESPIKFGFREDQIVVTNTHNFCPVTLKVKVTNKMRLLFQIHPMEMTIPYSSSANFVVRVCSKNCNNEYKNRDLVHFTIKIIVSGHKSIYRNVPAFFYELIIPCAAEYKKIYGNI